MAKRKKLEGLAKGMEEARRVEKDLNKKDQVKDARNAEKVAKALQSKGKKK